MSEGERNFSSRGRTTHKYDNTPPPKGSYEGKLRTADAKVDRSTNPKSAGLPYIGNWSIELLGTAIEDGGRNKRVFHSLFCSLEPGDDGKVLVDKADQAVALAMALGEELSMGTVEAKRNDGKRVMILSPQELCAWLKQQDGRLVKLETKVRAAKGEYSARAEVDFFIEGDAGDASKDGQEGFNDFSETSEVVEPEPEPEQPKPAPKPMQKQQVKVIGKKR